MRSILLFIISLNFVSIFSNSSVGDNIVAPAINLTGSEVVFLTKEEVKCFDEIISGLRVIDNNFDSFDNSMRSHNFESYYEYNYWILKYDAEVAVPLLRKNRITFTRRGYPSDRYYANEELRTKITILSTNIIERGGIKSISEKENANAVFEINRNLELLKNDIKACVLRCENKNLFLLTDDDLKKFENILNDLNDSCLQENNINKTDSKVAYFYWRYKYHELGNCPTLVPYSISFNKDIVLEKNNKNKDDVMKKINELTTKIQNGSQEIMFWK